MLKFVFSHFYLFLIISIGFVLAFPSSAEAPAVRIKNIARVLEARDNQLMGFGLVVGLRNTGDNGQTG
ncbi:flagellar basal body P-ring protein FlgI, partial [Candidatus Saganbacteria bacterium]|nr:flagellar basal body P-ring protein FlgI [Candidatus Saganbacteria bacterium]